MFASCKLRGVKNQTVRFISLSPSALGEREKERLLTEAIKLGRNKTETHRDHLSVVASEIALRLATKRQQKDQKDRRKVERLLKSTAVDNVSTALQTLLSFCQISMHLSLSVLMLLLQVWAGF
jgi:hypothetical protein